MLEKVEFGDPKYWRAVDLPGFPDSYECYFWARVDVPVCNYEGWQIVCQRTSAGDFDYYDLMGTDEGLRPENIIERGPYIELSFLGSKEEK